MTQSNSIGVMQGRLSPPEEGHFQAFPRQSWRREFERAREAGFSYIEWIHDEYGRDANPIFTDSGLAELKALKEIHNISTPALCCDWFMDFPLFVPNRIEREERERHLLSLLAIVKRMNATRIVLPLVDNSSMKTESDKALVLKILNRALSEAEKYEIEIDLETDLAPVPFREFLGQLKHPLLKVNWDSGNSSGLGFVALEEFEAYGERIGSIHIKDRYRKPDGGIETRPLGEGSADFSDVFRAIRLIGYQGGLTLQVARGAPNDEVSFLRSQVEFVQRYLQPNRSLSRSVVGNSSRESAVSTEGK